MTENAKLNYRPASVYRKRDFFTIIFYWRSNPLVAFKRFRNTFDLNRIPDLEGRAMAAAIMAETITEALADGWNPETDSIPEDNGEMSPAILKQYFPEALQEAAKSILKKSTKERTHSSYKSHFKLFVEYLQEKKKYKILPEHFTKLDAQQYQDHLITLGFAPKTVNTKVDYASGLFKWMCKTDIVPANPFEFIDRLEEPDIEDEDALFTPDELTTIKNHLLEVYPELWLYFLFIYYCYMRPSSIMGIRLEDINLENKTIAIEPENHKNKKKAHKQLLELHLAYLKPYLDSLRHLPPETFLFSKKLKPGSTRVAPTRAAEAWLDFVKKQLGINKNAYHGKHTGSTMYIEANPTSEDLKWLQNQMSHSNLQTTSIYVNKRKKIKLDESKSNIPKI